MAKLAVVGIEGVICRPDGRNSPFANNHPIGPGMDLVACLDGMYSIAVTSASSDRAEVRKWLVDHGMAKHFSYLVPRELTMPEEPTGLFLAQLALLRSQGFSIGMAVVSNPAVAAAAHAEGVTCLLFTHPQYSRPEWRPDDDRGVRSWADIEAEIARQAELKAEDARVGVEAEDVGRYEAKT